MSSHLVLITCEAAGCSTLALPTYGVGVTELRETSVYKGDVIMKKTGETQIPFPH